MAKKRKQDAPGLEEVERTLYTSFSAAANSVSQLYTQSQYQQKVAYEAGRRHSLDKVQQWIMREHSGAAYISVEQLMSFLQKEEEHADQTVNHSLPVSNSNSTTAGHFQSDGSPLAPFDPNKASAFVGAVASSQHRGITHAISQPASEHISHQHQQDFHDPQQSVLLGSTQGGHYNLSQLGQQIGLQEQENENHHSSYTYGMRQRIKGNHILNENDSNMDT